jgi:hypothetical protein
LNQNRSIVASVCGRLRLSAREDPDAPLFATPGDVVDATDTALAELRASEDRRSAEELSSTP